MSERASTSSSDFSGVALFLLSPLLSPFFSMTLTWGSGEARVLFGVEPFGSATDVCEGDVGFDAGPCDALMDSLLSCSFFSSVPKSVFPLSSSARSPNFDQLCRRGPEI